MTLMRGWFHIKRFYFTVVVEIIQPYILLIREYGQTMDVTVEDMPKSVYFQINRLISSEGLEEYEK